MFVPAALMVALAVAITFIPHLEEQTRAAAYTMTGTAQYQARVLDGAHLPEAHPAQLSLPMKGSMARSFGTTAAALALALFTLSPKWPLGKKRPYMYPIRGPLYALRAIHTGHVGDYVAFLAFGVAVVGLALELLIRAFGL